MTQTILPQTQLPPSQDGSGGRDAARLSSGVGKPPIDNDMAHKQPTARRDYTKSMIWAGLGLSGLSATALALVLGYSALTDLLTSGPSDSTTVSVPILAISTGVGLVTSILAFITGATAEMRSISGIQDDHRSLAGASSGIPSRDPTL